MKNILLIIGFLIFWPLAVWGAAFSFEPAALPLSPGAEATLKLYLDPMGELLNGVEGELTLPPGLSLVAANEAGSLISLWVTKPTPGATALRFAGVTPGGFATTRGLILTLRLKAEAGFTGGSLSWREAQVYLNDGLGTAKRAETAPVVFTLSAKPPLPVTPLPTSDTTPPDEFGPLLGRDSSLFGGEDFVSFAARDQESGVAYYELAEASRQFGVAELPGAGLDWRQVESPAALRPAPEGGYLYLRAVDAAGNARYTALSRPATYADRSPLILLAFLLLAFLLCILALYRALRGRRSSA